MTVFTNLTNAMAALDAVAPQIVERHKWGSAIPREHGGDLLFRVVSDDTSEDHVRDDGVSWSTDGTRSWEIVQHIAGRGWTHVVAGYYCHDKGGLGF